MFDVYLFAIAVGAYFLSDERSMGDDGSPLALGFGVVLAWVFVEALCLSVFGTTPGKWVFRIRIRPSGHARISYGEGLARSLKVWWRGLGAGIPFVSLFTLVVAYRHLDSQGTTSWDRDGGFVVEHGRLGVGRILGIVAFFLVVAMLGAAGG